VKEPRYYQSVAINRAVKAILSGDKRALLTMATGTGKTFVSLQIVWKLWNSEWRPDRKPRVLYLADRNILVDQPMEREYVPAFGEGPIWKRFGSTKSCHQPVGRSTPRQIPCGSRSSLTALVGGEAQRERVDARTTEPGEFR
jgi:hypothetical protein